MKLICICIGTMWASGLDLHAFHLPVHAVVGVMYACSGALGCRFVRDQENKCDRAPAILEEREKQEHEITRQLNLMKDLLPLEYRLNQLQLKVLGLLAPLIYAVG